ncbi:hypothetical protein T439DRAFT_356680 [Meredithblackwellia eburnea MCA 4105]
MVSLPIFIAISSLLVAQRTSCAPFPGGSGIVTSSPWITTVPTTGLASTVPTTTTHSSSHLITTGITTATAPVLTTGIGSGQELAARDLVEERSVCCITTSPWTVTTGSTSSTSASSSGTTSTHTPSPSV